MNFGRSLVRSARIAGSKRATFGGSLARNARFADSKCEFLRKFRTKRSFCRLEV